jgi:hypothetical protein
MVRRGELVACLGFDAVLTQSAVSLAHAGAFGRGSRSVLDLRLVPDIRYGTERYPEKVARRLRALNIAAWMGASVASGFAVMQFLDSTSDLWKVATVNALAAPVMAPPGSGGAAQRHCSSALGL